MNAIGLVEFPEFAANSGHLFARHFSSFIGKKAGAGNPEYIEALASLLVYLQSDGHVCLDMETPPVVQLGDTYYSVEMPPLESLVAELRSLGGDVLGLCDDPGMAPLILQAGRYLYLHRYWHYEQEVVRKIRALATTGRKQKIDFHKILFADKERNSRQFHAVEKALQSQLSIIAGGPGTGKTTVAVKIIAASLLRDMHMGIALAAPTGKAAARMKESIGENIGQIDIDQTIKEKVRNLETFTIHRLLGARYNSPYFRHDRSNPIQHDFLIVDESSMIDLPMMAKLLDAVGENTRVVLIGDPHQLPPVEIGSIFGQIVGSSIYADSVTTLIENFRSKESPDILKLCEQVNTGDVSGALDLLESGSAQVSWKKVSSEKDMRQIVREGAKQYRSLFAGSKSGKSILANSRQFRILTALRGGPFGAESLNARISNQVDSEQELLLITRNDSDNNIFNGDVGVKVLVDDKELVWIDGWDQPVSPLRIPDHQLAYAMTGHKAQGSEFDEVHVVLPTDENCPLLTREWLYTAVSRARRSVTIWSNEAALRKCLANKVERASGLFLP